MPAPKPPTLLARRPSDRLEMELALLEPTLAPTARPALTGAPRPAAARPHVLVVDDDADLRAYVRACLQLHCWITEAADGADAFAKAARIRPALVVTDALMPLVGGAGLCRALRADPDLRGVPILAISGEWNALDGADAFLRKPFTRQQLVAAVQALLGAAL